MLPNLRCLRYQQSLPFFRYLKWLVYFGDEWQEHVGEEHVKNHIHVGDPKQNQEYIYHMGMVEKSPIYQILGNLGVGVLRSWCTAFTPGVDLKNPAFGMIHVE